MTAEQNKQIVTNAWSGTGKGDLKPLLDAMHDNVSWLVPGNIPGVSGLKRGKDEIMKFMGGIGNVFPDGLHTEIRRAYADGDTVVLELNNKGKVSNGKFYDNDYCFVFELENGKIRSIREYVDTQKAKDTLFA